MRTCLVRSLDVEKAWLQMVQAWGRSPECVRSCTVNLLGERQALPHSVHSKTTLPIGPPRPLSPNPAEPPLPPPLEGSSLSRLRATIANLATCQVEGRVKSTLLERVY